MAIKLLTPREAKMSSEKKRDTDLSQVALLSDTLKHLQDRINTENAQFDARMVQQREVYGKARDDMKDEIHALEGQIERLEATRATLMKPIDEIRARAEEMLAQAKKKESEIIVREQEADELIHTMQSRLDDLTTRECILRDSEVAFQLRSKGVEEEAKQVSEGHARLNASLLAFQTDIASKIKELNEKEKALNIKQDKVQEVLVEFYAQRAKLDTREKHLNELEKEITLKKNL